ncbi:hypothetical protein AGABI1DRAFT_44549 [Agaricus bisporus var. burnettii JB137-S8]|uniref:5-formyltetrahydrofolate cyclo-ligase n=1 Tax=Agaricus bisporus var. burnettii (strain JB137-S8 / ATCC MYA-4627 / FGSC 10392) TaxID=597362 RepID=K5X1G9_AGABU|nr:uncharacterized protein AGABI1DRAFT_44549 [Agaricus bisporus var. burnettii JB137-S8]EKM76747.1 hypothetical protein AGABI1DRAFT_44549 [Agaricus bisporus var. burnettii JB137-S8]
MSTIQSLKIQKRALRKAIGSKLSAIPTQSIQEQSYSIIQHLGSFPAFSRSKSLSCYLSMPSGEVDTSSLVSEILDSGRTLFVPKITNRSGEMEFLKLYGKADLASLPNGVWGIKEPDSDWQELDLILLPAVAFDRNFARLGHGKGYYDRFITKYQTTFHKKPLLENYPFFRLVGLALREQLLEKERIPIDKHDWSMDFIVTPDEVLTNSSPVSFDASENAG